MKSLNGTFHLTICLFEGRENKGSKRKRERTKKESIGAKAVNQQKGDGDE